MELRIADHPEVRQLLDELERARREWTSFPPPDPGLAARLAENARLESVASSCRMTGLRLSRADILSMVEGRGPSIREASEMRGYHRALGRPFPAEGPLVTTDEIRLLHAVVQGGDETAEPSPWRTEPLHVEAFDPDGKATGRVFQVLPPRLIPEKMEALATWLELELRSAEQAPVLTVGGFILAFLAASPFPNANARTARVMARHLLLRAGLPWVAFASLDREIEESREAYHEALNTAETRLWSGEADLMPWIRYFLGMVIRQAVGAMEVVDLERRASQLSHLQRAILEAVREHGTVGAGLLMSVTGANRNTLKDNLRRLVDRGMLERSGSRRGTRYRMAGGGPMTVAAVAPAPARDPQPVS